MVRRGAGGVMVGVTFVGWEGGAVAVEVLQSTEWDGGTWCLALV